MFVVSWQFIPFHALLYQGGVRQIPRSIYEAAEMDGAGRIRQFFSVTLPQLKYTVITSSTLVVAGSLTFFDLIYVLTVGGAGDATRVLAVDMYKRGFEANLMGSASAVAVILVLVGLAFALLLRRLGGKDASQSQFEVPDMTTPQQQAIPYRGRPRNPVRNPVKRGRDWLGGMAGWLWLAIVVIPVYWVLITSFKLQSNYYASNPLLPPSDPVLDNYRFVIEAGFVGYLVNSVVVTAGAVVPAVVVSFMAAYAIVRGWRLRFLRMVNGLFPMGLAIPLQATVIPLYLIMIRLRLFDSLLPLILTQSPERQTLPLAAANC